MDRTEKFQWQALEYEEKERSADWFWALGIIVVTASIAAIIYSNYLFAALIILSGGLLWFFAIKKPDMIFYELNNKGLRIGNRLYLYENMKSFFVQTNREDSDDKKPVLFIRSERSFMPILSIPIEHDVAIKIHNIFISKNVKEEELKGHVSETVMETLGF